VSIQRQRQAGFTLIEISIVLLIVSILLGYTVAMFPIQQELRQYRQVDTEMNEILAELIGFAQINGRLPCPDTSGGGGTIDGAEDFDDQRINVSDTSGTDTIPDGCLAYFGFLPRVTLGMNGSIDPEGRLLDPWGRPYLYHISEEEGSNNLVDMVTPNEIRKEGIAAVSSVAGAPDLFICSDSTSTGDDDDCGDVSGVEVAANVVAVIVSRGKDKGAVASNIQAENTDDLHDGTDDKVYISSRRNDNTGSEYDDVVKWISLPRLLTKMIDAGQLP